MKSTVWSRSYANIEYVVHGATRAEAEQWARQNVPQGWHLVNVTAIKGSANFTVRVRRSKAKGLFA